METNLMAAPTEVGDQSDTAVDEEGEKDGKCVQELLLTCDGSQERSPIMMDRNTLSDAHVHLSNGDLDSVGMLNQQNMEVASNISQKADCEVRNGESVNDSSKPNIDGDHQPTLQKDLEDITSSDSVSIPSTETISENDADVNESKMDVCSDSDQQPENCHNKDDRLAQTAEISENSDSLSGMECSSVNEEETLAKSGPEPQIIYPDCDNLGEVAAANDADIKAESESSIQDLPSKVDEAAECSMSSVSSICDNSEARSSESPPDSASANSPVHPMNNISTDHVHSPSPPMIADNLSKSQSHSNSCITEKKEDTKLQLKIVSAQASNKTIPKARKSGLPLKPNAVLASQIRTVNLAPIANLTVRLPADSAHLLDSKPRTVLPVTKTPSISKSKKQTSPLSPRKKSPMSKFRRKKRRRVRYGTYNLPNEKKNKKKKKDENTVKSDQDDSEKISEKSKCEERSKGLLVNKNADDNVKVVTVYPPKSVSSIHNSNLTLSKSGAGNKTITSTVKTTSALDYLTQNSHRAFQSGTNILSKKLGVKRTISKTPYLKQKTVAEMIQDKHVVTSEPLVLNKSTGHKSISTDSAHSLKRRSVMKRKSDSVVASSTSFVPVTSKVTSFGNEKKRKIDGPSPKQIPIAPAAPSFITLNGTTVLANIRSPQSISQTIPVNVATGAHNTSVIRLAFVSKNNLVLPASNPAVTSTPKSLIFGSSKISPTVNISGAENKTLPSVLNLVPVVQTTPAIVSNTQTVNSRGASLLAVELTKPLLGTSVSTQQTTTVTNATSLLKFVTVPSTTSVQSPVTSLSPSQQSPLLSQIVSSTPICFKPNSSIGVETTYPVTPPKTPDQGLSEINCPPTGTPTSPDRDIIPLCCCKLNGASFNKLSAVVTYCQALDSVDGKVMGCCNKINNSQLVRPAVKIPFMAFCESHRRRLRQHNCCPGCGHFCTQGKYYQCKKDSGLSAHHYHKQCQVFRDGKYFCPHCGEESMQFEVSLTLHEPRSLSMVENQKPKVKQNTQRAKMNRRLKMKSINAEEERAVTLLLEKLNKTLSSAGLSGYPEKEYLDKVLTDLTTGERPKKYKLMTKNLYDAAYSGDLDKCVFLLSDGLDPNENNPDYDDQYPLHAAAESGSLAITHVLLQAGANLHCVDKHLRTPLMLACENNHLRVVKCFLGAGAITESKDQDGMDALHYAAKAGHTGILKYLLDYGKVNVNSEDNGGWTAIIWAAEHRFVDTVRYLLHCGADPNKKDQEENTSLHWASYSGSVIIAEIFLDYGCDIESVNQNGDRPLHIAARQHHYECVVLLLARGADAEAKNNGGEMPIDCCLDKSTAVGVALQVNKQLKSFAAKRFGRTERLVHRDITCGKENIPIPCLNGVDDVSCPTDYQYITENVETTPLSINRTINSLHSCRCKDDCASLLCNCGRNSVKVWYDDGGRLAESVSHLDPPLIFECNKACRCWTTCNNRVVQHGLRARLQLVKTDGRGWGVQTVLDIQKGTFICEYIGELITDCEADSRENDSYLFDLDNKDGDTYCIDARQYGNIARFINHLCEPNIIPVKVFINHQDLRFPHICFFASRDIKAYEELGFDYGEKFWIIKWKQFTCACGSPKCKYSKDTIQKTLEEYRSRHEEDECPTPEVPGPSTT